MELYSKSALKDYVSYSLRLKSFIVVFRIFMRTLTLGYNRKKFYRSCFREKKKLNVPRQPKNNKKAILVVSHLVT